MPDDWPKPIRRKVAKAEAPYRGLGLWVRYVELSCGHRQTVSASTYDRVPKTTICHICTRMNEDKLFPPQKAPAH